MSRFIVYRLPLRSVASELVEQHGKLVIVDAATLSVTLLICLLLWSLAYQVPFRLWLPVGGDATTYPYRREDDKPYLQNVNGSEPGQDGVLEWWTLAPGHGYRWTRSDSAFVVPGVGGGPWQISLLVSSGRRDGAVAASEWQAGNRVLSSLPISATARRIHLLADANLAGDLRLQMRTVPYIVPDDPRDLGFVLRDIRVAPATAGLRLPALAQLGWLAATLALIYTLSRWLALSRLPATALVGACALVIAIILATQRTALTVFTPTLATLALSCGVLALIVRAGLWILRSPSAIDGRFNAVLALMLLAFAIRLAGMLHPQAIFSDHKFNANNLFKVELGFIHFTAGLPAEASGGQAPYPPGVYLLLAPAQLLLPSDSDSRVRLVQSGVALLDSLVVGLIWLLLWRAGAGPRAALLGAALYLVPPPLMDSFSVGEYANIGGQALALPAIALLALRSKLVGTHATLLLATLIAIGLLGHFGVALTLGLFLMGFWAAGFGLRIARAGVLEIQQLTCTIGAGALAAFSVFLLYYSAPRFSAIFAQRLAGGDNAHGAAGLPLERIIAGITLDLFAGDSLLLPLMVAVGLLGVALLWWSLPASKGAPGLRLVVFAWWLAVLFAQGLLLVAGQGVRWQHFIYPALCLGAGPALAACRRRGWAGRITTVGVLALLLSAGANMWVLAIRDYLHS